MAIKKFSELNESDSRKDYEKLSKEVRDLISTISKTLDKHEADHKKKPNWGFVGDLEYAKDKLEELKNFLGGPVK